MIIGLVVVAAGLLVLALAWAGKVGKLPRNYIAGIRLPSTLRSDTAWKAGHQASWLMTAVAALFIVALGVRIMMIGAAESEREMWWFVGPMLLCLLVSAVQAHRAAKATEKRS